MENRWGKNGNSDRFSFLGGSKVTADHNYSHEIQRRLFLGRKAITNLDSLSKSRDITLPTEVCIVKAMIFPVVIQMWELDHKEGWVLKNWYFETMVLEKTVESPLDCKEIKLQGNQPWIFFGRIDAEAEAEALTLWPTVVKSRNIRKYPDAGKDCRQRE